MILKCIQEIMKESSSKKARFIRTLKTKIYKYMTSIPICIVNEYNSTYHTSIKMKQVDVKDNTYIENFKIKKIFAKGYIPNWS